MVAVELSAAERLRPSPVLWVAVAALGTVTVALLFAFIGMWLGWGPRRELPAQQREQYPALRYRPPPPMAVPTTYPRPATGVAPLSVWGNTEALVRLDAQGQPVGQQTAVAVAEGATETQGQADGAGATWARLEGYAAGSGPDSAAPAPPDDHLRGFAGGAVDRERAEGDERG